MGSRMIIRSVCKIRICTNYIQMKKKINVQHLYMNLACLSVCLSVCLFVSNKRQNGWTDRAQIFCGTSRDSREGLWIIKILNICLHQNSIVIKFLKILKIREIFCENPRIFFVLFYDVHKENMFTTNLEDRREAPWISSLYINLACIYIFFLYCFFIIKTVLQITRLQVIEMIKKNCPKMLAVT